MERARLARSIIGGASEHWLGSVEFGREQKATSAPLLYRPAWSGERGQRESGVRRGFAHPRFLAPYWVKTDTVETNEIVDA